jgi:hypothetical protein
MSDPYLTQAKAIMQTPIKTLLEMKQFLEGLKILVYWDKQGDLRKIIWSYLGMK